MPNAPPQHVSFSQFSDWIQCGKAYELRRLLGVPERPAWWFVGGHGVHRAAEDFDRQQFEEAGR